MCAGERKIYFSSCHTLRSVTIATGYVYINLYSHPIVLEFLEGKIPIIKENEKKS